MTDQPRAFEQAGNEIPLLADKHYESGSVFTAENLLREARRQKGLPLGQVPPICVLDPDGDLVDYLESSHRASYLDSWACYHTRLAVFKEAGIEYGVIGRVVGAPFAVLVAEELFAAGCQLVISITSAGQINFTGQPPYMVLIDQALRDEGTSYHYLPPAPYSYLERSLKEILLAGWETHIVPLQVGASWTTDAPFRETAQAIEAAREKGILAVEMEAAALYALAEAKGRAVVCFAHITNQMAQTEGDFEKGQAQGSLTALEVISQTARLWLKNAERLTR